MGNKVSTNKRERSNYWNTCSWVTYLYHVWAIRSERDSGEHSKKPVKETYSKFLILSDLLLPAWPYSVYNYKTKTNQPPSEQYFGWQIPQISQNYANTGLTLRTGWFFICLLYLLKETENSVIHTQPLTLVQKAAYDCLFCFSNPTLLTELSCLQTDTLILTRIFHILALGHFIFKMM